MRVLMASLIICVLGFLPGIPNCLAEQSAKSKDAASQKTKAEAFRETVQKKMKFHKCLISGKPECYQQFQDAVKWCNENWELCMAFIEGDGIHASGYGGQILRKCSEKLSMRCREEAGLK